MVFCCRELLFSKLFYRHQQQQPPLPVLRAAAGNRSFFSRISDDTLALFSCGFGPCSSFRAMVFCCRELLFSKLFYRHQQQQPPLPVLRPAASNRSFFSRISDDTLGTFFVWFWTLLVLQSHGVLLPGAAFFEAVLPASAAAAAAASSASSRRQQKLFF